MARCTAPVNGHRTASGAAACPVCSSRSRGYGSSRPTPHPTPRLGAAGAVEAARWVRQQRKAALVRRFVRG